MINILQVFIINLYFPCLDTQYRKEQYKNTIQTKVRGKPKCLQYTLKSYSYFIWYKITLTNG